MAQSIIDKHTQRIRELINKPLILNNTLRKKAKRYKIYSCLDVIGDTELAIEAFTSNKSVSESGLLYLFIYGILQILFVQQDAVFNLCNSVGIEKKIEDYPDLKEIRNIRHTATGHPTEKSIPSEIPTSYNFIIRVSMTHDKFELTSILKNGNQNYKHVAIPGLIEIQQTNISTILSDVIDKLEKDEMKCKEEFKMDKLISCFSDSLNYYLSNVLLGTTEKEYQRRGKASLPVIQQALQDYGNKLTKRRINIGECHLEYGQIMYALRNLEEFYQTPDSEENTNISRDTAYIFAFFLQHWWILQSFIFYRFC